MDRYKPTLLVFFSVLACLTLSWAPAASRAADDQPAASRAADAQPVAARKAIMIPLHEDINPISGELLKRKFAEAVESDVDVVILDIHSPGGLVYVTIELMDMILDAKDVETVAFIQKDAISGAALISLACDKIIMLPSARMGDAGEIVMGADGAFRYTEAKSRSVLAQKVRDTAQATGRPIALAEKMTDKDMIVFQAVDKEDGTVRYISDKEWESMENTDQWEKGKPVREAGKEMFFTVNGARAVELGMADQTVSSETELAEALGVEMPIPVMERTGTDTLILILNTGFVTFLLLVIGLVALVFELSAPGIGIGGLTSMLCFGLFFWSRFLGGTAGWFEVTLFVMGIAFIGMEIFVIPRIWDRRCWRNWADALFVGDGVATHPRSGQFRGTCQPGLGRDDCPGRVRCVHGRVIDISQLHRRHTGTEPPDAQASSRVGRHVVCWRNGRHVRRAIAGLAKGCRRRCRRRLGTAQARRENECRRFHRRRRDRRRFCGQRRVNPSHRQTRRQSRRTSRLASPPRVPPRGARIAKFRPPVAQCSTSDLRLREVCADRDRFSVARRPMQCADSGKNPVSYSRQLTPCPLP